MFRHLSVRTKIFRKGEVIIRQGDPVEYVYLLESGSVYRNLFTEKGDAVIYEIKEPDDTMSCLIGVLTLYNQKEASNFTFVARTDCECLCIPAKDFVEWASDKPEVQNEILLLAVFYYNELREAFQSHQEGRIANRLCGLMLNCCTPEEEGPVIGKKYTFAEMAAMLGVHPVTVSRIIRYLQDEQVLEKGKGGLKVLDMDRLVLYAANKKILPYK